MKMRKVKTNLEIPEDAYLALATIDGFAKSQNLQDSPIQYSDNKLK